jgi:hypothetical protein
MRPAEGLPERLQVLREVTREIAERSTSICADAARTRAISEQLLAELRAAREARRSQRRSSP